MKLSHPMSRRTVALRLGAVLAACAALGAGAQEIFRFPAKGKVPVGYPAAYAGTISAAEQEGRLIIHSTTDRAVAAPLIDDFQLLYPRIEILYQDMNSTDLDSTYLSDLLTSPTSADILWSSAMDLQFNHAKSGHALAYESPEIAKLPAWAVWQNRAFATTYEPAVIVYNRNLLGPDEVPASHADLARLLVEKKERFAGKVVTYNIARSSTGFLLATQDEQAAPDFWAFMKALGGVGVRVVPTTEAMLTRVGKGVDLIAYNALGSYAFIEAKANPAIAYVYPRDYTLVVTRVMLIGEKASNPNAAKLWVDYVLSQRGQSVMANGANLFSLRADVEGTNTAAALAATLGQSVKPIALGPSLASNYADRVKRQAFVKQWQQAVGAKP
jgi:iron(III) transport system substrate-binding protein